MPLFAFQLAGIEHLLSRPGALLADEMGLGKTIQSIGALRVLAARGELGGALVVAPAGLVFQWRRQLRIWAPELRPSTVMGSAEERRRAWQAEAHVHLVSYESLKADAGLSAAYGPGRRRWGVVVLDEAQRIKTASTDGSRSIKRLHRDRSWALTGTPLENRLDDLVSILDFVVPGRFDPAGMAVGLRRLLTEVQLRRRRVEVLPDLPPKYVSTVHVELGPAQRHHYDRARTDGLVHLAGLGRDLRIAHVLELVLRLKQLCNFCPETGASAKLDDLRARLEVIVSAGDKALVFSQFVEAPFGLNRIATALAPFHPLVLTGALTPEERGAVLTAFEHDPDRRILLLSLKAGGVGLNLTSACHVFHFDRWWNPASEAQAEDRAHRIGQLRPVSVQSYLCIDTIEERIDEILSAKRILFGDIIDGIDTGHLRRLDLDELLLTLR